MSAKILHLEQIDLLPIEHADEVDRLRSFPPGRAVRVGELSAQLADAAGVDIALVPLVDVPSLAEPKAELVLIERRHRPLRRHRTPPAPVHAVKRTPRGWRSPADRRAAFRAPPRRPPDL